MIKAKEKLQEIANYNDNWDGEGAVEFPISVIILVSGILNSSGLEPEIVPCKNGTIQVNYQYNNKKLSFDVSLDATNYKLIVSVSYKYGTEVDFNGDTIDAFDIIFAETNDFTNFTMTNVRTANFIYNHLTIKSKNIFFINCNGFIYI